MICYLCSGVNLCLFLKIIFKLDPLAHICGVGVEIHVGLFVHEINESNITGQESQELIVKHCLGADNCEPEHHQWNIWIYHNYVKNNLFSFHFRSNSPAVRDLLCCH